MNNIKLKKIFSYDELKNIKSIDNSEKLINIKTYNKNILVESSNNDMNLYTEKEIYVRESVAKKLAKINENLSCNINLKINYGYRHPLVQEKYFIREKQKQRKLNPTLSEDDLTNLTHNFIAVPDVAGHTTGGAVDLTIVDSNGTELDMGTSIADFNKPDKLPTYANNLTSLQISNRKLLHDLMIAENFAPFYGEWWHFSYGDKEWAAFYDKGCAIYENLGNQGKGKRGYSGSSKSSSSRAAGEQRKSNQASRGSNKFKGGSNTHNGGSRGQSGQKSGY